MDVSWRASVWPLLVWDPLVLFKVDCCTVLVAHCFVFRIYATDEYVRLEMIIDLTLCSSPH
jgi:hypothetical protein